MAVIKHVGAPTRKTKGAIGDIYIDTKTGNRYKCTFAYSVNGECDCSWVSDKGVEVDVIETKHTEPNNEDVQEVIEKEHITEEPKEEVVKSPVVEEVKDVPKPRTNYARQYQKPNKK